MTDGSDDETDLPLTVVLAGLAIAVGDRDGDLPVLLAVAFAKLQNGVILELLLDPFLQRHQGQLEDFHRLDHAGSEQLTLLHPHAHRL